MRVAFAHHSSNADISGVTSWLMAFCKRLVHDGHYVTVHLQHFDDDPQHASILPFLRKLGIEIYAVRRSAILEENIRHTLNYLNHTQPDIFLPQCLHAHYLAAAHAGRQGLPWIFTMHSDDPDYWCVAQVITPELNGGKTVCVSQFLAQQLRLRVPITDPQVIPYGITVPNLQASFSHEPFRVAYSGRMVGNQKCIHQVVQTMISACKASSRLEADLIGDGPDRQYCEQLVSQASLSDRIRFLGRVSPEQVPKLLQHCQAILLMSDFEGLPVCLLEAMALGVVPVVRDIPSGIPELVYHDSTGILVSNDPEAASSALLRLSADPILWEYCSRNARSLISSQYTGDHCFSLWSDLIRQTNIAKQFVFPLETTNLSLKLPLEDMRFQAHYAQLQSGCRPLIFRSLIGKLKHAWKWV
jgi:colanic acid/amylovoran biosynthesis glycosyltransferase